MLDILGAADRPYPTISVLKGRSIHPFIAHKIIALFVHLLHPLGILGASTTLRLAHWLMRGQSSLVLVRHADGFSFACPTYDTYWSHYIYAQRAYEDDILALYRRMKDSEFVFIDCGANIGYWSAALSSKEFGSHPTVAIEASQSSFVVLEETARLQKFIPLHRAVSDQDNVEMAFVESGRHEGRRLMLFADPAQHSEPVMNVRTITLDRLKDIYFPRCSRFVVKLDFVWTAELAALRGATELAQNETIFVYEEHGMDPSCIVTTYLFEHGFSVFAPKDAGCLSRVDFDQVVTAKNAIRGRRRAFNLVATKHDQLLPNFGLDALL